MFGLIVLLTACILFGVFGGGLVRLLYTMFMVVASLLVGLIIIGPVLGSFFFPH